MFFNPNGAVSKKTGGALLLLVILFVSTSALAQEGANRIMANRGNRQNQQDTLTQRRMPVFPDYTSDLVSPEGPNQTITHYQFIDAKIVTTIDAKEYTAVFGLAQEAPTVRDTNKKLQDQINAFRQSLASIGINTDQTFVDFITQTRVYDFVVKGATAREKVSGFQIKENFIIRYSDRKLLDQILVLASQAGIFDLIKVDYLVGDLTQTRAQLFNEAARVIKNKEESYAKVGIKLTPITVSFEQFDVFQPFEGYNSYKAYESGDVDSAYNVVEKRKNSTYYFDPLPEAKFDAVLKPIGSTPEVQCTYYLRIKYFVSSRITVVADDNKKPN